MPDQEDQFPIVPHTPLQELKTDKWVPIWDYKKTHKGPGGVVIRRLYGWSYTAGYPWDYTETYIYTWWYTDRKGKLKPVKQPSLWDHILWLQTEFDFGQWDLECRRWKHLEQEAVNQGHTWVTRDWETTLQVREGFLHEQETNGGDYSDNSN